MMKKGTRNISAAVHYQILEIAKRSGRTFNSVLLQYFQERFLYRLSVSQFREQLVLKGALLLLLYDIKAERPTKDIDFLAIGFPLSDTVFIKMYHQIISVELNDGVEFEPDDLKLEAIKKDQANKGLRLFCNASLGKAKTRMHFDIACGDQIIPHPVEMDFPVLQRATEGGESVILISSKVYVRPNCLRTFKAFQRRSGWCFITC